jgi:hypothetical protein
VETTIVSLILLSMTRHRRLPTTIIVAHHSRQSLLAVASACAQKNDATSRKKVKAEKFAAVAAAAGMNNNNENSTNKADEDDYEIEILDAVQMPSSLVVVCPPLTAATTVAATGGAENNDDDIQLVGTVGRVRLPHLRQDCTEHPLAQCSPGGFYVKSISHNTKCCDLCYCYVCDKPASECRQWTSAAGVGNGDGHCHATNTMVYLRNQRQLYKENPALGAVAGAASAAVDDDDDDDCGMDDVGEEEEAFAAEADPFRHTLLASRGGGGGSGTNQGATSGAHGTGPWAPEDVRAKQDGTLMQCWLCRHYNRFAGVRNHVGAADWCHACGRIAKTTLESNRVAASTLPSRAMSFGYQYHDVLYARARSAKNAKVPSAVATSGK